MRILTLCFLFTFSALASTSDFQSHFFVNGKKVKGMQHMMVMPDKPTLIEMYFTDPRTNEIYKNFKLMHGKYMHMVITSSDLSVFKHVHPYFDPTTGRFALTLNMPYADPDNQDARMSLEKPGMYMVMADVIVAGVGMRMDHAMVHVMGQEKQSRLIQDPHIEGVITKYFKRDDEEIPEFKAIFNQRTVSGCSGNIVNFEIEMFRNNNGVYEPFMDFEPWLSEAAHSVWMSEGYMRHMHHNMPFAHMHSGFMLDDDEDESNDRVGDHILRFNFHDSGIMLKGLQKMWVQFKHQGKVMKIPFVFEYSPQGIEDCTN